MKFLYYISCNYLVIYPDIINHTFEILITCIIIMFSSDQNSVMVIESTDAGLAGWMNSVSITRSGLTPC